ncbi:biotin-dependent carboxylase uncharacterized domain-containing protein [Flavobacteriaceae bacterium MAR_2010_188]|nr:biotin-dependent carboxylase uncharacterized domain-containing protein [Flavobacteriaceae bacterium MAR_2010_188]
MIEVLHPGFYSTIQDLGRFNYINFGVPISGPMNAYSANHANAILGNNINSALLEMTMTGAKLKFNIDTNIAVTGALMQPLLNDTPVAQGESLEITSGDVLSFGRLTKGFRTYLAIKGGLDSEVMLQSRSMYAGITSRQYLIKNQILKILPESNISELINTNSFFSILDKKEIEVFKGPEFGMLSEIQKESLFSSIFTVSKYNNRMAYQLENTLENDLESILTAPVLPGTVQLTPSGKMIILMRDCQTTGGYPRILQLSEEAINVMAQKMAGNEIQFKELEYS